jgi:hypothetical protein
MRLLLALLLPWLQFLPSGDPLQRLFVCCYSFR